jgi:uncharacterized protein (DUF2336 family)
LADEVLLEIAKTRTQEHMLAIARRPTISETVTAVVMQRGDERVLRTMSSNDGARFSEESFAELVEKARTDPKIQRALHSRGDVPYTTRTKLVGIAREVADATLQSELGPDALPKVEAALTAAAERLAKSQDSRILLNDLPASVLYVQQAATAGRVNDQQIVRWLEKGNTEPALAAVAHFTGARPI